MTNQFPDNRKKVELQAVKPLKDIFKSELSPYWYWMYIKKQEPLSQEDEQKYLDFLEKCERNLKLINDYLYLSSKNRELNSFEKGIKEEIERLLNEQE